ncbi:Mitochondrial inner membrane organizing system component [Savitreella phatthalungensis]
MASEDLISDKWDLCLSNAIVKGGIGFGAGVIASVVLFRRRPWPVFTGLGFGLGQSYSECNRHFNPLLIPGQKLVKDGEGKQRSGSA